MLPHVAQALAMSAALGAIEEDQGDETSIHVLSKVVPAAEEAVEEAIAKHDKVRILGPCGRVDKVLPALSEKVRRHGRSLAKHLLDRRRRRQQQMEENLKDPGFGILEASEFAASRSMDIYGATQSPVARALYTTWREYCTLVPLGPLLDVLPGGPDEELKVKMEETFAGEALLTKVRALVATMTAAQSLWKPLAPGQTRGQLCRACTKQLQMKGLELPSSVREMVEAAAAAP